MFEALQSLPASAQLLLPLVFSFFGGLISLLFQPIISHFNKRLELSGRAWERVQDRRLDAYEALLSLAKNLKITSKTGRHENGFLETKTVHLDSKESFEDLMALFTEFEVIWTDWVDYRTTQHTRYLADYFQNLRTALDQVDETEMEALAVLIKPDFINLASQTIDIAHDFFSKIDKRRLKIKGNGKYSLKKTYRLLSRTELTKFMRERDLLLKNY